MRSRVLFSVLVIAAALALVGGATFAVFTDSQWASGSVNAATINLRVDEDPSDDTSEDEVIFEAAAENLLPGEYIEETLRIKNTGNRPWDLTYTETYSGSGVDCNPSGPEFYTTLTWTDPDGDNHDSVRHVVPDHYEQVVVRVTLHSDATNACQNATYSVMLTFNATQHGP